MFAKQPRVKLCIESFLPWPPDFSRANQLVALQRERLCWSLKRRLAYNISKGYESHATKLLLVIS
jgi:hypothetical protein